MSEKTDNISIPDMLFAEEARLKLLHGINKLNSAVKTTMGPKGRTVLIQNKFKSFLTKDGVTVAKHVNLSDNLENMGAQLIKEVASKTAQEAGDGTTTATVLASEMYKLGMKYITSGANPIELKEGMDLALEDVLTELKLFTKTVSDITELEQVATISANGAKEIGTMVAEAIDEVGLDGVITVEEAKGIEDELKITKGMQFKNGYLSPYFSTDAQKMEVNFKDAYILIYNARIPNLKTILPVLEKVQSSKKPLLIITNTIDDEALNTLIVNKMRGNLDVCVVKSPGFGNVIEHLKDIQILTGGNIQDPEKGVYFTEVSNDLGFADNVIVTNNSCTIVCKNTDESKVNERVLELKEQLKNEKTFKDELKERIAKLTGGVATIKVQAPSELETKEKKDRVDDALGATKAAQEEGIIVGGGTALLKLDLYDKLKELYGDINLGYRIVLDAIKKPFFQILENAGQTPEVIQSKMELLPEYGFNVKTFEYGNLFDMGIIDSYKVQRVALTNAVSVSSTLISTECILPLNI